MDTALFLTSVALVMIALWLAAIAFRLARENRERSAARVDALKRVALGDDLAAFDVLRPVEPEVVTRPGGVTATQMFGAVDEPAAPPRRWMSFAAVAAVMVVVLGTAWALGSSAAVDAPRSAAPVTRATPPPEPIALVSLQHSFDRSGRFVVAGVVKNPAHGAALGRVVTVVTVFDASGNPIAVRETSLVEPLAPDAQASFTATIPELHGISRYTVTFQSSDGRAIPHVDRRNRQAL